LNISHKKEKNASVITLYKLKTKKYSTKSLHDGLGVFNGGGGEGTLLGV